MISISLGKSHFNHVFFPKISLYCLSEFSHSSLSFYKTVILNSISDITKLASLSLVIGEILFSLCDGMFP